MKNKRLSVLIGLLLIGMASESSAAHTSWFNWRNYQPNWPNWQSMRNYAPYGLGGATIGSGFGYTAGKYFGYDPRMIALAGALLGGGLGAYYGRPQGIRLDPTY